jgi:peptidoglycan/LPS O-acetylase OafA/YrhL
MAAEPWRLGHRPGLDGLRGVAVLLVVVCHLIDDRWHNPLGGIGVTVFFTLSGFLITALLLEEADRTGRVSLARFYARRARRLLPALLVMVAVVTAFQTATGMVPLGLVVPVIAYVGNWWAAAGTYLGLLSHTWSLSIEEQFYLLWPLALLLVRRWRYGPATIVLAGIAASMALRFALWNDGAGYARVYAGSDTRADALLIGCLLALALVHGVRLRVHAVVAAGLGLATIVVVSMMPFRAAVTLWAPTLVPIVTAALIVSALGAGGWLSNSVLRYFGSRSYGLYLWHFPLVVAAWLATDSFAVASLAILLSVGIAELSWRFVEQPFLRGRKADGAPRQQISVKQPEGPGVALPAQLES